MYNREHNGRWDSKAETEMGGMSEYKKRPLFYVALRT